jgi:hypothetical protein
MKKVMANSDTSTKHWIIKRCARDCGAHAILQQRKEKDDDHCPFCSLSDSVEHVYLYNDERVKTIWSKNIEELKLFLQKVGTYPEIITQLLEGLESWKHQTPFPAKPMIWDQSQIGWNGVIEGVLGLHWMEPQDHYTNDNQKAVNGSKWAHLIIRKLCKIAWELWQNRNAEAHSNDQEQLLERLHAKVIDEVTIEARGYADMERFFEEQELEQVRNGNSVFISCWLITIRARREQHQQREQMTPTFVQMRDAMRRFLLR